MQRKWDSIQALRALAAGMVFVGHLLLSTGSAFPRPPELEFAMAMVTSPLCHAGVDLFFVISGAIMYLITRNSSGGPAAAGTFIFRRALRIYPLFLIAMSAALLVSNIELTPSDAIKQFTLFEPASAFAVAWTLGYEIRFYLVVAVAMLVLRGSGDRRFLVVSAAILAMVGLGQVFRMAPDPLITPLMLEFLFGALVAAVATRTARFGGSSLILGLAMLCGVLIWAIPVGLPAALQNRTAAFGIPAAFVLYGAMALERSGRIAVPRFLVAAGNMSYSIYLWHIPLISVLLLFWPRGEFRWLLGYYAAATISLTVVAIVSFYVIERPTSMGLSTLLRRLQANQIAT